MSAPWNRLLAFWSCFALLLAACPALGQTAPALNAPTRGNLPSLTPVKAPESRCGALSEVHRVVVFGHDGRKRLDAHLSLVKLDEKGFPAAFATTWKMPCPPALQKVGPYPLALALHPKLPLLYVWQDVAIHFGNPPTAPPAEVAQLDHLLIYDVSRPVPELVTALCRGQDDFLYGQEGAALAVDPSGGFLFVSNQRDPKNYGHFRVGRFPLDADGLPDVLAEGDRKLPRDQRVKKLNEKNVAGPLTPPALSPFDYGYILGYSQVGSAQGMHVVSPEAVLVGGSRGLVLWRPDDKACALNLLPIKGAGNTLLASHPDRPLLYAVTANSSLICRLCHSEGYPTLLPEQWTIPGVRLHTAPVVLKGDTLAVGSAYHVYLVPLDGDGRPRPEVVRVQVFNPLVRALMYSPRFDRLYVPVEESK